MTPRFSIFVPALLFLTSCSSSSPEQARNGSELRLSNDTFVLCTLPTLVTLQVTVMEPGLFGDVPAENVAVHGGAAIFSDTIFVPDSSIQAGAGDGPGWTEQEGVPCYGSGSSRVELSEGEIYSNSFTTASDENGVAHINAYVRDLFTDCSVYTNDPWYDATSCNIDPTRILVSIGVDEVSATITLAGE